MNTDLAGKMKKVTSKREVKIRIKKKIQQRLIDDLRLKQELYNRTDG